METEVSPEFLFLLRSLNITPPVKSFLDELP